MSTPPAGRTPQPVAALLVFGDEPSREGLRDAGIQIELFLEELDRSLAREDVPRYRWQVLDPSCEGGRVKVGATPRDGDHGVQQAFSILDHARWGIAALRRSARRPPQFTDLSLRHLVAFAALVQRPGVSRLVFYADQTSERITPRTLENLRALIGD